MPGDRQRNDEDQVTRAGHDFVRKFPQALQATDLSAHHFPVGDADQFGALSEGHVVAGRVATFEVAQVFEKVFAFGRGQGDIR